MNPLVIQRCDVTPVSSTSPAKDTRDKYYLHAIKCTLTFFKRLFFKKPHTQIPGEFGLV